MQGAGLRVSLIFLPHFEWLNNLLTDLMMKLLNNLLIDLMCDEMIEWLTNLPTDLMHDEMTE